jgi:molybdopterin converting factor small subunit
MQITFKLYAQLTQYLPPELRVGNRIELDVPVDASIASIIDLFQLPMKFVHLVLINGVYVPPAERATRALVAGDVLAIWPPVAGG